MQTERKMLEASRMIGRVTQNQDVLRQTETKIREAERSLQYFEETIRDLQARKTQLAQGGGDHGQSSGPSGQQPGLPTSPRQVRPGAQTSPSSPYESSRPSGQPNDPSRPYPSDGVVATRPKQYSNLDLIRAETPLNDAKISRMLHQLEFKLQVEKQYKAGIDKMARLYQADGDKRSRADAEAKRVESDRKIALLSSAMKRYKTLHVLDVADDDEEEGQPESAARYVDS
jgi:hypothetical protein